MSARAEALLKETPLFANLSPEALTRLAALSHFRATKRGEVLFQQGDASDRLYVMARGTATLSILSEDGHELIVHILQPGTGFGEVALLDGRSRTATCTIRDPGEVLTLNRSVFLDLLDDPSVARAVIDRLCVMLRLATDKVELLAHKPLRARLAHVLLSEATPGTPPKVTNTQQELAYMCSGARPRINQILKAFEDEGLIGKDGRTILLRDRAGLEDAAQSQADD
ncbi:Crp/Fnr family transcriptional regulator [Oceanibium sediminis]|uniref:Crp/Fnr family transcriptional regulator n=1 Tax=Oceanibium sediminis TaxID=2026339 RepID=UPI000DD3A959|nr:Crp/Fnr family transcriptional regulator [Oceanibium sediminis]